MSDQIDYGNLMHDAMRGLIHRVLSDVAENGLPGEHHFFITFDTGHPDVQLAGWLRDRFPDDMTIVLQHEYSDLKIGIDGFSVTLSFSNTPENMYVPYDAIRTFVDPAVEFGLRFETQEEDGDDGDEAEMLEAEDTDEAQHDAEIVSLDQFRK